MPEGNAEPGKFRSARTPYMIPFLRRCAKARCKKATLVTGSQMAKTENVLNVAGHRLQDDPVPVLYVGPTKSMVEKMIEPRVLAMIRSAPVLHARYATRKKQSKTRKQIGAVALRLAWAGSATELAADPAGVVIVDERDRMEDDVGGEGDPVAVADARHFTYPDGITIVTSTPKIGTIETKLNPDTGLEHWAEVDPKDLGSPIWKLWQEGSRHEWSWPCPDCGQYFIPRFRLLKWPKGATPQIAKKEARLLCPHCGVLIGDDRKTEMNARGVAVAPGQKVAEDGTISGLEPENDSYSLWVSGLCSPWVSFGQRAHAFVTAVRSGQPGRIQAVINTGFGELYSATGDAPPWEKVYALRKPHKLGEVPDDVLLLFMTVDVQKDRLIYVIRGWGDRMSSWLVQRGEIMGETEHDAVWEELQAFRDVRIGETELGIHALWIDSGYRPGDKFKRPDNQIYLFCRKNRGWAYATKGRDKLDKPIKPSLIDISVGGKVLKKGLQLWHIDTDYFKSWVHARLDWPEDSPGGWFVPDDIDEDYCKQIVAEARVTKPSGQFVWLRVRPDNHDLDCEMLQAAAAHHFNVWKLRGTRQPRTDENPTPKKSTRRVVRSSYMGR